MRAAMADDAPDDPGADDLIMAQADDDRPLDMDWNAEALETDSFSDVVTSGGEEAFDFRAGRIFGRFAFRASW
jgi:RNA polymerase sigma-54 factor